VARTLLSAVFDLVWISGVGLTTKHGIRLVSRLAAEQS